MLWRSDKEIKSWIQKAFILKAFKFSNFLHFLSCYFPLKQLITKTSLVFEYNRFSLLSIVKQPSLSSFYIFYVYLVNLRCTVLFSFRIKLYIDYIFLNKLFIELPRRYFIAQHTNKKRWDSKNKYTRGRLHISGWYRKKQRRFVVRTSGVPLAP